MKNNLKVFRAKHDLTQQELANEVDVTRQTINAVECGRYEPSLGLAFDLAGYFDSSIEELFFRDDDA